MLNFDLMDTIEDAREMVLEVLEARFKMVPSETIDQIRIISQREVLKSLIRQATLCSDWASFKKILSKTTE